MSKVAVVILNYKVREETISCVKSVKESTFRDVDIVVVDNNSQDGIEEAINSFENIEFIQTGDNLGYSGGNNIGLKRALESNPNYIFILNPDTLLDKHCLEVLVKSMEDSPEVGIIGPKILFGDRKRIWFAGGIFDKANVLGKHRGVDEEDKGQYDKEWESDFISGGAMFVRAEVFKKIGLFDDRYFLYYEDSDLSFRAKQAGFALLYAPKAVVYHANAKSTGLGSPLQDYFITRNRMLLASKFLSLRTRFALFREALRNINNPNRRLALTDFLKGKLGKGSFIK